MGEDLPNCQKTDTTYTSPSWMATLRHPYEITEGKVAAAHHVRVPSMRRAGRAYRSSRFHVSSRLCLLTRWIRRCKKRPFEPRKKKDQKKMLSMGNNIVAVKAVCKSALGLFATSQKQNHICGQPS